MFLQVTEVARHGIVRLPDLQGGSYWHYQGVKKRTNVRRIESLKRVGDNMRGLRA